MFLKGGFDILLLQETRSDGSQNELKKWQKVFKCRQIYLSSYGTQAVGTGIIVRSEESFKVLHHFKDPLGRYVGIIGDHEEGKFLILSFYSPSISNEIKEFIINEIYAKLESLGEDLPQFLVIGGDTNTVFSALDKQGGNLVYKNEAIQAFEQLKQRFSLIDSYRVKNPDKSEFSWEVLNPTIIKERIDLIFVSNSLQDYVTETGILPVHKACSDHGVPYVKIKGFGIPSRGPGLWKLNNQLLQDKTYIAEINDMIPKWTMDAETDLSGNIAGQWGYIKYKIGEFSRDYGAKVKKAKQLMKLEIENQLKILDKNLNSCNKAQYQGLKEQLDEIVENEVKGAILRSLCDDYEKGEKCTKYFFDLEKFKAKQRTLSRVKSPSGTLISDQKVILEECRIFYKNLYSKNHEVDPAYQPDFFENENIPRISVGQLNSCESDLSEAELLKTLKSFKKNKSPGLDGLSAEFYLSFWDSLKDKLMAVYSQSFEVGILPEAMRIGVVTLLEKKGKDRSDIANWRPITLLNTDYKLLTKTLSLRLKPLLPSLVHGNQNGFVPGGSIFFSSHIVRDILFYCKKENIDLILLALDYTKAFDSVDFGFILKTFETYGFGPKFCNWIKIIYTEGKSCITNNGHLSETFEIERSTRQGDPISPMVFILGLEILLINIRSDDNIRGIVIENNELKLTAYADDASYFMKDKVAAEFLLQKVEIFSKISGLQINRSKSECLILNYEMNLRGYSESFLGIPVVENLKILGHFHGKSDRICNFHNFYSKLPKMAKILNMWKGRQLTIIGKNLLINSLSNSLFIYNAQIECPPKEFIKLVEKMHKEFLWNGVPKIAHHSIIADYSNGGIRYKDLNDFIASLNFKFLQQLSLKTESNSALPNYWIKNLFKIPTNTSLFFKTLGILDCPFKLPRQNQYRGHPFYYSILKDYEKILEKGCQELENVLSMPIWYNRYLGTKFDPEISNAGFNFMKDLFPNNQQIQDYGELSGYKCRKIRTILDRMPIDWKNKIQNSERCFLTVHPVLKIKCQGRVTPIKCLRGDQVYGLLIADKTKLPVGAVRWKDEFRLHDRDIKLAFNSARRCSSLVTDHMFQYKILTRILPTKKYLARYQIVNSSLCDRCNNEEDTIIHCLWACTVVQPYVSRFKEFLINRCSVDESMLSLKSLIFGCQDRGLNHIILELKKELFYTKELNMNLDTFCEHLERKIKRIMIKEKSIMIENGQFDEYDIKWKKFKIIYNYLGPDIQIV